MIRWVNTNIILPFYLILAPMSHLLTQTPSSAISSSPTDTVVVYTINYADSGWAGDICPRLHCMRNQSLWVPGGVWYVTACSILCCSWSSKTLDTNFIPLSPYPSSHYRSQGWNLKKLTEGHHQVSNSWLWYTYIPIPFHPMTCA